MRQYLSGDLAGVMARARAFPTFCEAILNKRDPILCERIGRVLRKGNAIAFVGVLHCQGITMRLREEGYRVGPPSEP